MPKKQTDIVLVGAGIMSATLAAMLKELQPDMTVEIFELLDAAAEESSNAWNNAGTGHAALCELNYTPQNPDGSVGIARALTVNTQYDLSQLFWAYMVRKGAMGDPDSFIHNVPHISFVWGDENVTFLRKRYDAMSAHHCFKGMEYSEDPAVLEGWMPLVMQGRDPLQRVAGTRMITGTDVDFGAVTRNLLAYLRSQPGVNVSYSHKVTNLRRTEDGDWSVSVKDEKSGQTRTLFAKTVFLGAGGGALKLLQKSGIEEGKGFGGFPVSGIFLQCDNAELVARHDAKVYGKASVGAPPMSVPHLDSRYVDGKRSMLFGPYAGFSTKFLKHGSVTDLFSSIKPDNIGPMLAVGRTNMDLTKYLVGQVLESKEHKYNALQDYFPSANPDDWKFIVAGQRVQVIMPDQKAGGKLQFGTEVVSSADGSLAAVLGASPGASVAVAVMLDVLGRLYKDKLAGWAPKMTEMIPSYGKSIADDAELCHTVRSYAADVLKLAKI
ncbi:MAG TPA: malate dehydrogenase (quinone), partial [Candidatus Acidoferrales bacterium]|nr:malate dehydrogenase (quinone) [Candidatus Acidoferrales bacterium]